MKQYARLDGSRKPLGRGVGVLRGKVAGFYPKGPLVIRSEPLLAFRSRKAVREVDLMPFWYFVLNLCSCFVIVFAEKKFVATYLPPLLTSTLPPYLSKARNSFTLYATVISRRRGGLRRRGSCGRLGGLRRRQNYGWLRWFVVSK